MLHGMTTKEGFVLHLTNHCLRVITITVLGAPDVQDCHITKVTGHNRVESSCSYSEQPTFEQFRLILNELASFVVESGLSFTGYIDYIQTLCSGVADAEVQHGQSMAGLVNTSW